MSIETYPISIMPNSLSWSLKATNQKFTSPFSGATQTLGLGGELWTATLTYNAIKSDKYNTLNAFLLKQRGMQGRFYLPTPQYTSTLGNVTGSGTGTALTLNTGIAGLNVGHYISINHELKIITDKTSDTAYNVSPPFRNAVSGTVEVNNPDCLMMLASDETAMQFGACGFESITFDCIEALE